MKKKKLDHADEVVVLDLPLVDVQKWECSPRNQNYPGLDDLLESIRINGILEPLVVWFSKKRGCYLTIAGERRRECAIRLDLQSVPCVVKSFEEDAAAYAALLLLQRKHLSFSPMEESLGLVYLQEMGGLDVSELAAAVGEEPDRVQLLLSLQDLPGEARDALDRGLMDLGTAQLLLDLEGADVRSTAVQEILHPEFSVRALVGESAEAVVRSHLRRQAERVVWAGLVPKLKKRFPAAKRFFVEPDFSNCELLCRDNGEPIGQMVRISEPVDARLVAEGGKPMLWGELAEKHEAAVTVAAAPALKDGFVLLTRRDALMDAERAAYESGGGSDLVVRGWRRPASSEDGEDAGADGVDEKGRSEERPRAVVRDVFFLCCSPIGESVELSDRADVWMRCSEWLDRGATSITLEVVR